jgi:hypothetical protein
MNPRRRRLARSRRRGERFRLGALCRALHDHLLADGEGGWIGQPADLADIVRASTWPWCGPYPR